MIPAVSAVSWACGEANDMIFAKDTPSISIISTDAAPKKGNADLAGILIIAGEKNQVENAEQDQQETEESGSGIHTGLVSCLI